MLLKVVKNTFFLSASQIIARLAGFSYFILLARFLGVRDFGVYSFTLAFIYNFIPVADFGLERLVLRDIAREPQKAGFYLSRLLPLRLLFSVGAYLAAMALGLILGQSVQQLFYLLVFGLALIPYNLTFLLASFQNAREKMEYMSLANIALVLLTAIFGVIFVVLKLSLVWVLFAYPLANLFLAAFFLWNFKNWGIAFSWKVDLEFWKKALSESWVFAVLIILAVFYLRLSVVIVGLVKGAEATGNYSSAYKFVEAAILIPQSLALALFPLSSKLMVEDKEKLKKVYFRGMGILFALSLPFSLGLIFLSRFIVRFAFGPQYLAAIPVFGVLGIALVFFFINALAGNIIQNSKEVKQFLPLAVLNFLVALALCLVLIPRFSIAGAAWAVVGGEIFGLLLNNFFVFKILKS